MSMKKNILRQCGLLDPDQFEFKHMRDQIPEYMCADGIVASYKRIVYGLVYFHSQILERKKFGPAGYNSNYDFTDEDV